MSMFIKLDGITLSDNQITVLLKSLNRVVVPTVIDRKVLHEACINEYKRRGYIPLMWEMQMRKVLSERPDRMRFIKMLQEKGQDEEVLNRMTTSALKEKYLAAL